MKRIPYIWITAYCVIPFIMVFWYLVYHDNAEWYTQFCRAFRESDIDRIIIAIMSVVLAITTFIVQSQTKSIDAVLSNIKDIPKDIIARIERYTTIKVKKKQRTDRTISIILLVVSVVTTCIFYIHTAQFVLVDDKLTIFLLILIFYLQIIKIFDALIYNNKVEEFSNQVSEFVTQYKINEEQKTKFNAVKV